jgi:hypothetical protein
MLNLGSRCEVFAKFKAAEKIPGGSTADLDNLKRRKTCNPCWETNTFPLSSIAYSS